ncbi:MAG: ABC transporter permease [Deltaproteobacteria bacterium]|nr:ABC transporter permease [Deltaproteobacteria bacterium]
MGVFIRIALRNLMQARLRSFFLTVALSLVTMLLVILLGLSQGLTETIVKNATTLASGHLNVAGFFKAKASDANPIVTHRAEVRKAVEESITGVDFIIDRARGWARVVSDVSSMNAGLTGVDAKEESRLFEILQLAKQSEYKEGGSDEVKGDARRLANKNTALIFAAQAKRLEVDVGDKLTVAVETMKGARNTAEFEIVGIARDIGIMSNWSVFTDKASLLELYRLDADVTGAIQIYLDDVDRAPKAMGELRLALEDKGYTVMEHDPRPFWAKFEGVSGEDWTGQRLDLTTWSDEVSFLLWIITAVDSISFVLVGILVVIIAVGIMNSMWMSVRERTPEVGTLRAIGMSRRRVLLMFMLEALILGLVATSLGGAAGAFIARSIDAAHVHVSVDAVRLILMSDTLHLSVGVQQVLTAVIAFTLISGLSALWPAYRASRLQPVTAIQHIG